MTVNRELLNLYWELGREICEKQEEANWGEGLIDQLAKDLSAAFPGVKGLSLPYPIAPLENRITSTKNFTEVDQNERITLVQEVIALIPWGHNLDIITKCKDVQEALFYVQGTVTNNWSRAVLVAQMESKLYERQGKAIQNFQLAMPGPQADLARETLKNPYNFDFLMLGKEAGERDLEDALTAHIQKFIMELGQGFAYMGRQFPIDVGGDMFYLDLLFYHTRLRCYVIIELKATEFKPEYAGKLNFYLNVVNAQLKHPQDQPSIGILLCKTPNKIMVEYALENIASPLGVAEYQIMSAIPDNLKGDLPSIEELEQELGESVMIG